MRELLSKLNDIFDRRTKRSWALATLGSLIVSVFDTVAIALVLPLVDLATGSGTDSGMAGTVSRLLGVSDAGTLTLILTVTVVALFILKDLGSMVFMWWMVGFTLRQRFETSSRLLRHFLLSPYTTVSRRSSAELIRTMNDSVASVFNLTVSSLMASITNALSIIAVTAALMIVAPLPTVAVVAYFGLAALLYMTLVKPRATAAGVTMVEASTRGWRTALAALGGIKELHLRGTQEHFVRNYWHASMEGASAARVAGFLGGLPKYILEILFILAVGLILLVGAGTESPTGGSGIGLLALFVAASFRVLPSVTGLLGSLSSIKVGGAALEVVHAEVMAAKELEAAPAADGVDRPLRRSLRIERVSFRYPDGDTDVLDAATLEVAKGTSVALVGGSGAGKTTLVDLILGLHTPTAGRITVDGVDISEHLQSWQRNIGYVPQSVFILDATLAENIAFDQDRDDIDEVRLRRAVRQAELEELVGVLPDGVDTPLGEHGARLSGGQRQRVGIARALYREPELLVLDEATSALDNETEHRISQTIGHLRGNVTVVIVAHRLSTVRHADQIVFLKDGRVETTGTFEQVREVNAEFARLVKLGSLGPATEWQAGPLVEDGGLADIAAQEPHHE